MALLALAGCGYPATTARVAIEHEIAQMPAGASVLVVPLYEGDQDQPEWQANARKVEAKLAAAGMRIATVADRPDLVAVYGYDVGEPRQIVTTYTMPNYSLAGFRGSRGAFGLVSRSNEETRTELRYPRNVSISLFDFATRDPVWEMRLSSEGDCPNVAAIMDDLLAAAFRDFPGPSGETRTVSVERQAQGC